MLKIRDDVDLKELEKFGFEYEEEDGENIGVSICQIININYLSMKMIEK